MNIQNQLQVEHGGNHPESPKLSVSGERYRRVQHVYTGSRVVRGENNHNHEHDYDLLHAWCDVHKLNTENNGSGNPEIGHLRETNPVFNLHDASKSDLSNDNNPLQETPVNTDVSNTKSPNTNVDTAKTPIQGNHLD